MNQLLLRPDDISAQGVAILVGEKSRQLLSDVGCKPGDRIRIGVREGRIGSAVLQHVDGDRIVLFCTLDQEPPRACDVDLILALPRPKALKRLWPQLGALGVRSVYLVNAEGVERCYFDSHWLEKEHYEPLLVDGLEQSGYTRMPHVHVVRRLRPFLEDKAGDLFGDARRLVADSSGAPILSVLREPVKNAVVAVGPERGWTIFELDLMKQQGFTVVSMGQGMLRCDTASVGLLCMVQAAMAG